MKSTIIDAGKSGCVENYLFDTIMVNATPISCRGFGVADYFPESEDAGFMSAEEEVSPERP